MIRFVCGCGRQLQARDEDIGKKAKCPSCEKVMTVPSNGDAEDGPKKERPRPDAVREDRPSETAGRRRDRDGEDDYDDEDDRGRRRKPRRQGAEQNSGKATASMVLGLVSLCLPVLPAIPGLILGILALRQIGASKGRLGGRGLAITGIVTSSLSFILLAPVAIIFALLLPAVSKVREAAMRTQDQNNLRQIGIAFHNFADVNRRLPQATAFRTKDGQPGLSWRVALLPYVEQDMLFRQFKLDEAWDSPHNKPLVGQIPRVYLLPSQQPDGSGSTYYQVFVGKSTLFETPKVEPKKKGPPPPPLGGLPFGPQFGVRFPVDVTDGTSNTILVTTARSPVPWTKPDDLEFNLDAPLPVLGGHQPRGYNILLGDGSVRWIPQSTPEPTIRALVTRNGGEVVNIP